MKKNSVIFILAGVLVLACTITLYFSFRTVRSKLFLEGEPLIAMNREAEKAVLKNPSAHSRMYFKFSANQYTHFVNMKNSFSGAALKITVSAEDGNNSDEESSFGFGFLYSGDFEKNGTLKKIIDRRPISTASFKTGEVNEFSMSQCVKKNADVPVGFFVYSSVPLSISEALFVSAQTGFDRSGEVPYFAFTSDGGRADFSFSEFDFTPAKNYFSSVNSETELMPSIKIKMKAESDIGSWKNQKQIELLYGDEKITILRSAAIQEAVLQTAAFKNSFEKISFKSQNDSVLSVMMKNQDEKQLPLQLNGHNAVLEPLCSDAGMIFDYPKENWRSPDYELFSWELFPEVLFFDFADYKTQDKFLTRLAYFTEKEGYIGTLVNDWIVENKHGYNAHDYKPESLAAFFTKVNETQFPINDYEKILCRILVHNRIIIQNADGSFSPGSGAIISISKESSSSLRRQLSAHESWHGIYFTDEDFRNTMSVCYYMFDPKSLDFLKVYWSTHPNLGYDTDNDYLMQNELMAYIMQNSFPSGVENYFLNLTQRDTIPSSKRYLAKYVRQNKAQAFVDAGAVLNDYVFSRWGLAAGRVSLILR